MTHEAPKVNTYQSPESMSDAGMVTPSVDEMLHTEHSVAPEISPASGDQLAQIGDSSRDMLSELPLQRHTEEDGLNTVDVDQAELDDVAVKHVVGQNGDVTVITPKLEENGASQDIVIDNSQGAVFIDGRPVNETEADQVSRVIDKIRNTQKESMTEGETNISRKDTKEQEANHPESDSEVQTDPEAEAKLINQKRQVIGGLSQFLRTRNGMQALQLVAQQLDVKPQDLQARLKGGDIRITPDSGKAFQELMRNGAKPNSPVWAEDVRNPSLLGGAARESQQLLTDTLRSLL